MKTAVLIQDNLPNFNGHAALYQLSEPLAAESWYDEPKTGYGYVVVSACYAVFSGPETYIFGADEKGEVAAWGELPGSYRGGLDHAQVLEEAGYQIVSAS